MDDNPQILFMRESGVLYRLAHNLHSEHRKCIESEQNTKAEHFMEALKILQRSPVLQVYAVPRSGDKRRLDLNMYCLPEDDSRLFYEKQTHEMRQILKPLNDDIENPFDAIAHSWKWAVLTDRWVAGEVVAVPYWKALLDQVVNNPALEMRAINQGIDVPTKVEWNGLELGSPPEKAIADALEDAGVLFFTNSPARLGSAEWRHFRKPDFVVCYKGKWGIIEVDGKMAHPPKSWVQDRAKDEEYHYHDISVVRHYTGSECLDDPKGVVGKFLSQLEKFAK